MNPALDVIDNAFEAVRRPTRLDAIRMARIAAVRVLVRERLEAIDRHVVVSRCGPIGTTASENFRSNTESYQLFTPLTALELQAFTVVECSSFATIPDPIAEERRFLRRVLRLLNKVITIALRREAFHRFLQRTVLRQRSFFITHGNHPPPLFLRYRTVPRGRAA